MKSNYYILIFVLLVTSVFGQVPSINVTKTFSTSKMSPLEKKKLDSLETILNTVKSQKGGDENTKADRIKNIEEEITKTKKENYFYKSNAAYYKNQCDKIEEKISKLVADMKLAEKDDNRLRLDQYEAEIEVLKKDLENLNVERDRLLHPTTHNYSWFLPSKDKKYRNAFFKDTYNNSINKTNYINAFSIVGSPNGVTGQSEIVSDNLGMFRVTFGTVISASNDSLSNENTRVEALQRLINGGGNFYLDFTAPLVTTITGNNDDLINFYGFVNLKAASDIEGYGNDLTTSTYNTSLGVNLYGDISTDNRKFNFFFIANANYYYLSTKEFYEALGVFHKNGFLSGKITIGVTILNQFRFSANVVSYGSEPTVRSSKFGFGLQFLPNL